MQKTSLSAFMDGELLDNELTVRLCKDEELQESWQNYHLLRSVMRQESDVLLGTDFTANLADAIEKEEIQTAQISQPTPQETENHPFVKQLKRLLMPMVQIGVAAGVCLVAVTGVQSLVAEKQDVSVDNPVLQTLPFNQQVQEVSYNVNSQPLVTPEQRELKNKRITQMLQTYELQRRMYSDKSGASTTP